MQFDRNQKKAISFPFGNLLVVAGPGSGKTAVLTERIHYLTEFLGADEQEILVLTFTKASAEEMKERYLRRTGKSRTSVTFGTFHSVFWRFLKQDGRFRNAKIIEPEEERKLIGNLLKEGRAGEDSGEQAERIRSDLSRMKNGLSPDDPASADYGRAFETYCRENRVIGYDDILVLFARLLVDDPEVLNQLRCRYRYILIDEFQDINRIQYEIVRMICGNTGRVFAVGDDDQSIYGFRGSSPEYLTRFRKEFKGCRSIVLDHNYRSTGSIVKAASRLIAENRQRIPKRIRAARRQGLVPVIRAFHDLKEEAAAIEDRIRELDTAARKAETAPLTYALLARTNSALEEIRSFLSPEMSGRIDFRTFHSAKGLEYDAVFISHANENVTPGKNRRSSELLEEERRCFYVAVTRCRSYLHIFYTCVPYNQKDSESRFVDEMARGTGRLRFLR